MDRGKNALKNLYSQKAIWYLESEIELLKLLILQTKTHLLNYSESNKSKVYFIPNSKDGLGIDSMGELATTFELSCQFINEEGEPAPFIHIAHSLENAFNFSLGDAYKSKYRIFSRKAYNLTKALDALKTALFKEYKRRKSEQKNKDEKR